MTVWSGAEFVIVTSVADGVSVIPVPAVRPLTEKSGPVPSTTSDSVPPVEARLLTDPVLVIVRWLLTASSVMFIPDPAVTVLTSKTGAAETSTRS